MSILSIEAFSGLSGDMFLGALAGLTDSYKELENLPKMLGLDDAKIEISKVDKNGIVCNHVQVIDLNSDNDHHHHRHLSDINKIIENSSISDNAKQIAKDIFLIIGKSESKIHDIAIEKIHFHEVSGVDSIVDIVGCAVLIDQLSITKTYATAVCTGFGFVHTQHGLLPVPAPATADILLGIPTYAGDEKGEKVTPTGAAILKYLKPDFHIPELIKLNNMYGPGKKEFKTPNVLRLSLCEELAVSEKMYMLETNIDDLSSELLGEFFQEGILNHGAVDFYFSHVQMKKGRPGLLLSCSVPEKDLQKLSDYILENTSTIGIRYFPVDRNVLQREIRTFKTKYGEVKVKIVSTPSKRKRITIEYNDLLVLGKKWNLPLPLLQQKIRNEIDQDNTLLS